MRKYKFPNEPFIAVLSYDTPSDDIIVPLSQLDKSEIKFRFCDDAGQKQNAPSYYLKKFPMSFSEYKARFELVQKHLKKGDSYLLNLCFATKISTNLSLEEIFTHASAKAVIYKKNDFVCFTPEPFVVIENGEISAFPMKGTIEAELPNAAEILLNDEKEFSESAMMLDLMRNDLGKIATNVRVEYFRKISKAKNLLQTSSKITAILLPGLSLGEIFSALLPAGSITGTPKNETCKIIEQAESGKRGFYSGVFVYFDGKVCKSFVMIRFIKQQGHELYFHSGGGITAQSDARKEYDELISKIYFPF